MPFTLAHPALILPLIRRHKPFLSATGLVVGAIVPDFEYFFEIEEAYRTSHTLKGILVFNLPVAILLAVLFHAFVRNATVEHLPPYFRNRIKPQSNRVWFSYLRKNWFVFLISILIGAASHLLWDSFTELDTTLLAEITPFLVKKVIVLGTGIERGRILQHLSTAAGLGVVAWYIHRQPIVRESALQKEKVWQLLVFWALIGVFSLLYLYATWPKGAVSHQVAKAVVKLMSGGLLGLLFLSLFYNLRQRLAKV